MDKTTFCIILESALLSFDGVSEEELISKYSIPKNLARAGVNLCDYLKSIKMGEQNDNK